MAMRLGLRILVVLTVLMPAMAWSDTTPTPISSTPAATPTPPVETQASSTPQPEIMDRHPVDRVVLLTASAICPDSDDGRKLCRQRTRLELAAKAASSVVEQANRQGLPLTAEQGRIFADAALSRQTLSEESIMQSGTKMVALTMAGRLSLDRLQVMLQSAQKNLQLFSAAKTEYDRVQAEVAQLNAKALQSPDSVRDAVRARMAEANEQKKEVLMDMLVASNVVSESVMPGMTPDDVEALAGPPRSVTSDPSGMFLCFNYGRAWVVFENGAAACLRKRLEFRRNLGSSCHCSGSMQSFIDFAH
ncbi:valyl-tRNA synthetase [Desulfovibrio inopinatus]|uniref:valyl-tRNA synthetase n=1 Tax=Desulfovibrio inopinatus TaxID=102109 RepID=UPI00041FDC46|nr:valyl-tRNA synthetase [Desulfovibrio inopinatus]